MKFSFKFLTLHLKLYKSTLIFLSITLLNFSIHGKEFRLLSIDDFDQHDALKFTNSNGIHKLFLKKYYLNSSRSVPKNNIIHFFPTKTDTSIPYNKSIYSISFLEQNSDSIILIEKDEDPAKAFKHTFFPNDKESFPELTLAVFNNTEKAVVTKIADQIIKIDPKMREFIPLPENNDGYFDAKVVFAAQRNDKSIDYFYSAFWRIYEDERKICFIDMDKLTETLKLVEITIK